jgi:nucleoside recognition membrane protein YjiH
MATLWALAGTAIVLLCSVIMLLVIETFKGIVRTILCIMVGIAVLLLGTIMANAQEVPSKHVTDLVGVTDAAKREA